MRLATFGRDPFTSRVVDSLFVGETENIGNPTTDAEKAYGRSLPKPQMPDFPIRGYEYYDYRHDVVNTTFRNYQDNATRKTGAISYLLYTSFGVSSNNAIENVKFVNAKPVYFPPMERKWGNDNVNGVAWKTAVFHDKDGSLGGVPNSYILINDGVNDSIATDAKACEIKPTWNAAVCKGDVGRLTFGGPGGVVGGGRAQVPAQLAAPVGRGWSWRGCRSWRTGCSGAVRSWRSWRSWCSGRSGRWRHLVASGAGGAGRPPLSRQSSSAAMAGSTPSPRPTYEPAPRSR